MISKAENAALFLDRDGTLNFDPGYLGDPELLKLYPGVGKGLAEIKNKFNIKLIVISNQAGITRGLLTKEQVDSVNNKLNELLAEFDVQIDDFFYCPFHPDFDPPSKISCRKPSPEMILDAASKHNISLEKSFMIGDRKSDIECGINAGVKTILIRNEWNNDEIKLLKNDEKTPNFVAVDFLDACNFIMNDFVENNT